MGKYGSGLKYYSSIFGWDGNLYIAKENGKTGPGGYKYNPDTVEFSNLEGYLIPTDYVTLNNPQEGRIHYLASNIPLPYSNYARIVAYDLQTKVASNVTPQRYYIGKVDLVTQVGKFAYSVVAGTNISIFKTDLSTGVTTEIKTTTKSRDYTTITSFTYKGDGVFYITANPVYFYSGEGSTDLDGQGVDLYEWVESTNKITLLATKIPMDYRGPVVLDDGNLIKQLHKTVYSFYEAGRIYLIDFYSLKNSSSSRYYNSYFRHFVINVAQKKLELLQANHTATMLNMARCGDTYYYVESGKDTGTDLVEYHYQKD